ncbi:MAG: PAS domain S-box protein [Solirubrobacterales bacterium]
MKYGTDRVRQYLDAAGIMLVVLSPQGEIRMINQKGCEILGTESTIVLGRNWCQTFLPEDARNTFRRTLQQLREASAVEEILECQVISQTGEPRRVLWHMTMINDEMGQQVEILCSGEDVTLRRQMEAALRDSEERYRELFENASDMIFITDLNWHISHVNRAVEIATGYSVQEVFGNDIRSLLQNSERIDPEAVMLQMKRGRPAFFESVIRTRDHREIYVDVSSRLVFRDGVPLAIQGIARDVTERKRMEEKLRFISLHDTLTGLYNRAYFNEEMRRMESGRFDPVGILVCDVDGLKLVNDNFGHDAGDALIVTAAGILRPCFRENDVVSRIGGDEFAVLIPRCSQALLEEICRRVETGVTDYNQGKPRIPVSLSIGSSLRELSGSEEITMTDLFREADNKMYEMKAARKRGVYHALLRKMQEGITEAGTKLEVDRLLHGTWEPSKDGE